MHLLGNRRHLGSCERPRGVPSQICDIVLVLDLERPAGIEHPAADGADARVVQRFGDHGRRLARMKPVTYRGLQPEVIGVRLYRRPQCLHYLRRKHKRLFFSQRVRLSAHRAALRVRQQLLCRSRLRRRLRDSLRVRLVIVDQPAPVREPRRPLDGAGQRRRCEVGERSSPAGRFYSRLLRSHSLDTCCSSANQGYRKRAVYRTSYARWPR